MLNGTTKLITFTELLQFRAKKSLLQNIALQKCHRKNVTLCKSMVVHNAFVKDFYRAICVRAKVSTRAKVTLRANVSLVQK